MIKCSCLQPKQTETNPDSVSIHPATKALLHGKRPRPSRDDQRSSLLKSPRSSSTVASDSPSISSSPVHSSENQVKTEESNEGPAATETVLPCYVPPVSIPCYVPPNKKFDPFEVLPPRAIQHKTKRRIVVGNVSRFAAVLLLIFIKKVF